MSTTEDKVSYAKKYAFAYVVTLAGLILTLSGGIPMLVDGSVTGWNVFSTILGLIAVVRGALKFHSMPDNRQVQDK